MAVNIARLGAARVYNYHYDQLNRLVSSEGYKFKKAGGEVNSKQQVDHTVDLQLGGTNAMTNLNAIDASVNMSFGAQIKNQIRNLPDATRVNRVNVKSRHADHRSWDADHPCSGGLFCNYFEELVVQK